MLTRTRSPSLTEVPASIRSATHSVFFAAFCSRILALRLSVDCEARSLHRVTPRIASVGDAAFRSSEADAEEVADRYVRGCVGSIGAVEGGRLSSIFFTLSPRVCSCCCEKEFRENEQMMTVIIAILRLKLSISISLIRTIASREAVCIMALRLSMVAFPARDDKRLAGAADFLFPRPRTFPHPPRTRPCA